MRCLTPAARPPINLPAAERRARRRGQAVAAPSHRRASDRRSDRTSVACWRRMSGRRSKGSPAGKCSPSSPYRSARSPHGGSRSAPSRVAQPFVPFGVIRSGLFPLTARFAGRHAWRASRGANARGRTYQLSSSFSLCVLKSARSGIG
jgi:hypothetical protein